MDKIIQQIFNIRSDQEFNAICLQIFRYQSLKNDLYRRFIDQLGIDPESVRHYSGIPFLPVEFFRSHTIVTGDYNRFDKVFTSSGTSGAETSKHHVADTGIYEKSFLSGFRLFYGPPEHFVILALLPTYLEREASSLVYMADRLIKATGHPGSGFFLEHGPGLADAMEKRDRTVLLLGVTFALLDLAGEFEFNNPDLIIMETGGMKGRRKEMVREEVHSHLRKAFHVPEIHSEYGMTELLSQAYSTGHGIFRTPPWMKVLVRDANDPLSSSGPGKTGGLNIIDLANIHSCSFIATQDLGKIHPDGSFEVLGRFDASDIRGCNLLVE